MAERNIRPRHLILYDGDCGFCGRAVGFILPRDSRGVFRYDSLHSAEGDRVRAAHSLGTREPESLLVVPGSGMGGRALLQKSAAILFIVRHMDPPWNVLAVATCLPKALLDWAYDLVARHRRMLAQDSSACPFPMAAAGEDPQA